MSTSCEQVEDILLALIKNHGKHVVTEAATRTLPVITFAESNEAIGKLKDELAKVKEENTILNRLIMNLESEVVRQAKEVKDKTSTPPQPLLDRIADCPGAYITSSNPHKILVEDSEGDLLAEAISLSDDMVLATIHCEGGGASQVYMPLKHFLEFYIRL